MRADFEGGTLSSDFGPLLLRGVDCQLGLTQRLAEAFDDQRHASYVTHSVQALFAQRTYQIASAYEDGNDANAVRTDPVFKLGLERKPLGEDTDLASAPTFSRLENAATRKDLYRLAQAFVDQFIESYAKPPALIVLDMDHSEDEAHGGRSRSFTTLITGAAAISLYSSSRVSRASSSPLSCAPASVRAVRRTP